VINQPKVVIADEPTSALDDAATKEVIQLLEQQAQDSHAALVIVTHDARLTNYFKNKVHL
jgi:putative ABC transport system ATP-binding protein